jgi:ribosomal protein L31
MFLYGEYWKELLDDEFWNGRLFAVGNLRIDQYRRLKAEHQSTRRDNVFRIVLTAQGVDTPKLVAFLGDFLKLTGQGLEVELCIKLHPVYETDKEIYESAFPGDNRVRVISASEAPSTFELLSSADMHLSISSACHYDALGLGVPTVIIPLANCDWVLSLHRAGHASLARTPEELLEIVSQLGRQGKGGVPAALGAYYFRPDALENMKEALRT